jgi:hypothetical protein
MHPLNGFAASQKIHRKTAANWCFQRASAAQIVLNRQLS